MRRNIPSITAETAIRLAEVLGTTPKFWMNLQTNHDLALASMATRQAA